MKRKQGAYEDEDLQTKEATGNATPTRKSNRSRIATIKDYADVVTAETPTKRARGKQVVVDEDDGVITPLHKQKKPIDTRVNAITTTADRSAKRKSARLLISQVTNGDGSDDDASQDELLAREIFDEEDEDDAASAQYLAEQEQDDNLLPDTPSKRRRGRPKGWKKPPTPSPPPDLPAYEHYFFQNRPGGSKASDNTLPSSALISHEDYFTTMTSWKDPHEPGLDFLHALHSQSFDQWVFELEQGFNICTYGYGSKRELLLDFAQHLCSTVPDRKVVIINGQSSNLTPAHILATLSTTIPSLNPTAPTTKLGSQSTDTLTTILTALSQTSPPQSSRTTLIVHSIDAPSARRPQVQTLLARLASSPHISLLASADTPNFPLLWDATLRADFNFCFHDCTTFAPYDAEISAGSAGGVVDEVNALLGRSGRKMHGREGVMYVLKSLTQSARGLFGLLVAELLSVDEGEGMGGLDGGRADESEDDDDGDGLEFEDAVTPGRAVRRRKTGEGGRLNAGIEYRALYQKAVGQFIATNEMSFRGLLKEFHDHEMVVSRKDASGAEMLGVPFRREELETLLEELTVNG